MTTMRFPFLLSFLFLVLLSTSAFAQVKVAPVRVMTSATERSKEITLTNSSSSPLIIESRIVYAVLRSDSTGAMKYDSVGLDASARPSCAEWAKVFPKRFTIQAGEKRTVRVLISPPGGIADGEYVARLLVVSQPVDRPGATLDTTQVRTEIRTRVVTSLPVLFRKGNLTAGVRLDMINPTISTEGIRLLADLHPEGNSIYRGTLYADVFGADGARVAQTEEQVAVEVAVRQPMTIPTLSPGTYTIQVDARPVRQGSAAEAVIPAPEVRRIYRLAVAADRVSITPIASN